MLGAKDQKWDQMFESYDLLGKVDAEGFVDITAEQFHKLHFEPRLLTKHDHSSQVPAIMAKHGLTLLTLSKSAWRLGHFEIFASLPNWTSPAEGEIQVFSLPGWVKSIDPNRITGEPVALSAAFTSGILQEFCGADLAPTINGRHSAGSFAFEVTDSVHGAAQLHVASPQIEVDAGYESPQALWLFEAKLHLPSDFNLRQLYYPFRTWRERITKPVRTVYMTYANGVFDLCEYEFTEPSQLSSHAFMARSRFMINAVFPKEAEVVALAKASAGTALHVQTQAPYPQADDFERVIDLVSFLMSDDHQTRESIAANYDFDPRQSEYYFNAARYLGLAESVEVSGGGWRRATPAAIAIMELPYREQRLKFAERALAVPPVAAVYLEAVAGTPPTVARTQELLEASPASQGLSGSTLGRRSQTVNAWVHWLLKLDGRSLLEP